MLSACGNSDKNMPAEIISSESTQEESRSDEVESKESVSKNITVPLDVTGNWKQTNSQSIDSYQVAAIDEDTITIYWYSTEDKTYGLYWSGTFDAPKKNAFIVTSINYRDLTHSVKQASNAETKKIEYKDGYLYYNIDKSGKVCLEKTDEFEIETEKPDAEIVQSLINRNIYEKISGYDESTNQTVVFEGTQFSIPSYFDVRDEKSTDTWVHYYPEEKDYYCSLIFQSEKVDWSEEEFNSNKSNLDSTLMDSVTRNKDMELIKSEDVTIAGMPGFFVCYSETETQSPAVVNVCFLYDSNNHKIILIEETKDYNDESNYDYTGDFEKIVKSASRAKTEADTKSSVGINPDFKAMMDSYERFFNSYVEFMKKYSRSNDPLGMLADYTDYMSKYMDAMDKLEKIDTDELSTEDYKYYIDVMARIQKKLLEIYD